MNAFCASLNLDDVIVLRSSRPEKPPRKALTPSDSVSQAHINATGTLPVAGGEKEFGSIPQSLSNKIAIINTQ
jgi:hypothetical protein